MGQNQSRKRLPNAARKPEHEKLLDSLEFAFMNARRDELEEDSPSFDYVFDPDARDYDDFSGENSDDGGDLMDVGGSDTSTEVDATDLAEAASIFSDESTAEEITRVRTCEDPEANMLTQDTIPKWLESDQSIYWIQGKAGSGKSSLIRYLVESDNTITALKCWSENVTILSHFFWRLGSPLQQSTKGMLCSLLYQALESRPDVMDVILAEFGSLQSKSTDNDWSVEDLESVLTEVLKTHTSATCIFLDGLDELGENDNLSDLLEFLTKLGSAYKVKICVTSQANAQIEQQFSDSTQVNIKSMTAKAMQTYINRKLRYLFRQREVSSDVRIDIITKLLSKAEGVFFWLHFVLDKLRKGLLGSETISELLSHLDDIPNDLSEFRKHLCAEVNMDDSDCMTTAAQYFNLAVSNSSLMRESCLTFLNHYVNDRLGDELSLLHMMVATHPAIQDALLEEQTTLSSELIDQMSAACLETEKSIGARCGGLLSVTSGPRGELDVIEETIDSLNGPISYSNLIKASHRKVKFLHKSAHDFISSTQEGHFLRRFDTSSQDERWLHITKAFLGLAQTGRLGAKGHVYRAITPLSQITDPKLQPEVHRLMAICHKWYGRRVLRLFDRGYDVIETARELSPPFLALAAYPNLRDFIISTIKLDPNPASLATKVLLHLQDRDGSLDSDFEIYQHFLEPLLDLGADPNRKDVVCIDIQDQAKGFPVYDSAFIRFLKYFVRSNDDISPADMQALLQIFLRTDPDLNASTSIGVKICAVRAQTGHISELDEAHQFEKYSTLHTAPAEGDAVTDVAFLLAVNIAFLLDVLDNQMKQKHGRSISIFPTGERPTQIDPHAEVLTVFMRTHKTTKRYQLLEAQESPAIIHVLEPWVQGDRSEATLLCMDELVAKTLSSIENDDGKYKSVDSSFQVLAEGQHGYVAVSEAEFEDLLNKLE